jgi:hypothetical protein
VSPHQSLGLQPIRPQARMRPGGGCGSLWDLIKHRQVRRVTIIRLKVASERVLSPLAAPGIAAPRPVPYYPGPPAGICWRLGSKGADARSGQSQVLGRLMCWPDSSLDAFHAPFCRCNSWCASFAWAATRSCRPRRPSCRCPAWRPPRSPRGRSSTPSASASTSSPGERFQAAFLVNVQA